MTPRLPLLVIFAAAAVACGNKAGDAKPAASGSPAASASAPTAGASLEGGAVNPKIATLAKAVLSCKADDTSFNAACPAMRAWREAKDDFADGKADASLVAMLADADEKVRFLGAYKLNQHGKAYRTDKALAEAAVAAAEKEKSKFSARELGEAVGRIKVGSTGTFERVQAIVKAHELPPLARGVLARLLPDNGDFEPVFDFVRDTVKGGDKEIAHAAIRSLWTGGGSKPDATCQIYADNMESPNEEVAAEAVVSLAWYHKGNCPSRYDALLDVLQKRSKAGPGATDNMKTMWSGAHLCEDEKASVKQRKRAGDLARAAAGAKDLGTWARAAALETAVACDATGAKAFLAKFKQDPETSVAKKARDLLGEK